MNLKKQPSQKVTMVYAHIQLLLHVILWAGFTSNANIYQNCTLWCNVDLRWYGLQTSDPYMEDGGPATTVNYY